MFTNYDPEIVRNVIAKLVALLQPFPCAHEVQIGTRHLPYDGAVFCHRDEEDPERVVNVYFNTEDWSWFIQGSLNGAADVEFILGGLNPDEFAYTAVPMMVNYLGLTVSAAGMEKGGAPC